MMKWEYQIVAFNTAETVKDALDEYGEDTLDEYGAEGWELVSVVLIDGMMLSFFKRPVPDYTSTE